MNWLKILLLCALAVLVAGRVLRESSESSRSESSQHHRHHRRHHESSESSHHHRHHESSESSHHHRPRFSELSALASESSEPVAETSCNGACVLGQNCSDFNPCTDRDTCVSTREGNVCLGLTPRKCPPPPNDCHVSPVWEPNCALNQCQCRYAFSPRGTPCRHGRCDGFGECSDADFDEGSSEHGRHRGEHSRHRFDDDEHGSEESSGWHRHHENGDNEDGSEESSGWHRHHENGDNEDAFRFEHGRHHENGDDENGFEESSGRHHRHRYDDDE